MGARAAAHDQEGDPVSTRELLAKLRWKVGKSPKPIPLGHDLEVRLYRDSAHETANEVQSRAPEWSQLLIALTYKKTRHSYRALLRAHVETRGKSMWFNDNVWRLSEAGLDFWSANIDRLLADREASLR